MLAMLKKILLTLSLLFTALPARADVPTWSTGPSVTFIRSGFDCGPSDAACLTMLRAGAGWTLRYNTGIRSPDGQTAYVSIDGTLFADLSTLPTSGGMSIAAGPSFYNGLIGLEAGYKLFEVIDGASTEGLFTLDGGRRNLFFLVSLSVNLLLSPKLTLPSGAQPAPLPPNYFRPF